MNVNYSVEMTAELVEAYKAEPTEATVKEMAEKFGKTVKSVVAKLSREGVYVKKAYVTKKGEKPVAKAALVARLAELTGETEETFESLEKATKHSLEVLVKALEAV
jgi:predicted aconitase with swiveling domain